MIKILIQNNANVNLKTYKNKNNALMILCKNITSDDVKCIKIFFKYNISYNQLNKNKLSALDILMTTNRNKLNIASYLNKIIKFKNLGIYHEIYPEYKNIIDFKI